MYADLRVSPLLSLLLAHSREHLKVAEEKNTRDPPTLFAHQRAAVVATAREHIALFGGSGRAW